LVVAVVASAVEEDSGANADVVGDADVDADVDADAEVPGLGDTL
jgi:hypothetical protein